MVVTTPLLPVLLEASALSFAPLSLLVVLVAATLLLLPPLARFLSGWLLGLVPLLLKPLLTLLASKDGRTSPKAQRRRTILVMREKDDQTKTRTHTRTHAQGRDTAIARTLAS